MQGVNLYFSKLFDTLLVQMRYDIYTSLLGLSVMTSTLNLIFIINPLEATHTSAEQKIMPLDKLELLCIQYHNLKSKYGVSPINPPI